MAAPCRHDLLSLVSRRGARCTRLHGWSKQSAVEAVEKRMPKRVKRKRRIETDDGSDAGMEEYYDCECRDAVALFVCAWL